MIEMSLDCCRKCGSVLLHTKPKGKSVGLYCKNCCTLNMKQFDNKPVSALKFSKKNPSVQTENTPLNEYAYEGIRMITQLKEFVEYLEEKIDETLNSEVVSDHDAATKCAIALAHNEDKKIIQKILVGEQWKE